MLIFVARNQDLPGYTPTVNPVTPAAFSTCPRGVQVKGIELYAHGYSGSATVPGADAALPRRGVLLGIKVPLAAEHGNVTLLHLTLSSKCVALPHPEPTDLSWTISLS